MRLSQEERKRRDEMFENGFSWCSGCKRFLPVDQFYKSTERKEINNNFGLRRHCIECNSKDAEKNKSQLHDTMKERNSGRKIFWVKKLGGKCQHCGFDKYFGSLEFHHVKPEEKTDHPAIIINGGNSTDSYYNSFEELDKCCLLCSNCHRAIKTGELILTFEKIKFGYTVTSSESKFMDADYTPQLNLFD